MNQEQTYALVSAIIYCLTIIILGNTWAIALPILQKDNPSKESSKDLAHIYPIGAIGILFILSIFRLFNINYNAPNYLWIKPLASGINNILFLLAIPYYKHQKFNFIQKYSPKKWRTLILAIGIPIILISFLFQLLDSLQLFDSLLSNYLDFLFSIITLWLLSATFFVNLWNRHLKYVAILQILIIVCFAVRQFFVFGILKKDQFKNYHYYDSLESFFSYLGIIGFMLVLIAMGFSWFLEEVSIPVKKLIRIDIKNLQDDCITVKYFIPGKLETSVEVKHNKAQSALLMRYVTVMFKGEQEEGIKRNYLISKDFNDLTNISQSHQRIINEINAYISTKTETKIEKADLFDRSIDMYRLRCERENLKYPTSSGINHLLYEQMDKVKENNIKKFI